MGALGGMASRGAALVRAGSRLALTGATAAAVAVRCGGLARRGDPDGARAEALSAGCRAVLAHHAVEALVDGAPPAGAALLACNHVSWLDPIVVAAHRPCLPVSKQDLRGWPVIGPLAAGLGVIFYRRGDRGSGRDVLRAAERALRAGVAVLNFPEGTTTDGGGAAPFQRGLFGVALRLGVPVIPVALRYRPAELCWTGDATFLPHYLRLASSAGASVQLRFGRPIRAGSHATAAALAAAARAQVLTLLESA